MKLFVNNQTHGSIEKFMLVIELQIIIVALVTHQFLCILVFLFPVTFLLIYSNLHVSFPLNVRLLFSFFEPKKHGPTFFDRDWKFCNRTLTSENM